jgi:hypothetical protein
MKNLSARQAKLVIIVTDEEFCLIFSLWFFKFYSSRIWTRVRSQDFLVGGRCDKSSPSFLH